MGRAVCVFCGSVATMSGEHVYGDWLSGIGLDLTPVLHTGGRLNRVGRDYGTTPPFRTKVRDVCKACNNGWMSSLEGVARRTVTPFILGAPGAVEDAADLGALAAWTQKTALVAMLVSSEEERARGYGLPPGEYRQLYALRAEQVPLPSSRFWIGRYQPGHRNASTYVTPIVTSRHGVDRSETAAGPDGYLMTVIIGELLIHGLRFTTTEAEVTVCTSLEFPLLWPASGPVTWPTGAALTEADFFPFVDGRSLRVKEREVQVSRWIPATDLPRSEATGSAVRLPLACGEHAASYPRLLISEAMAGRFYVFVATCECADAYLIQTARDGARCKAIGPSERVLERYEMLDGEEVQIGYERGTFTCRRLPGRR